MRQEDIDLDRAVNDPEYRRKIIKQLNAEAAQGTDAGERQRLSAEAQPERAG